MALFSESVARAVVAVPPDRVGDLESVAATYGVPVTRLGTTGGESLTLDGLFDLPLSELQPAHESTLPDLFQADQPRTQPPFAVIMQLWLATTTA